MTLLEHHPRPACRNAGYKNAYSDRDCGVNHDGRPHIKIVGQSEWATSRHALPPHQPTICPAQQMHRLIEACRQSPPDCNDNSRHEQNLSWLGDHHADPDNTDRLP